MSTCPESYSKDVLLVTLAIHVAFWPKYWWWKQKQIALVSSFFILLDLFMFACYFYQFFYTLAGKVTYSTLVLNKVTVGKVTVDEF